MTAPSQDDRCQQCARPLQPRRNYVRKTGLCRHCWSIKALKLRGAK